MKRSAEEPNAFLWVLRGLCTAFLLGYLIVLYLSMIIYEIFPSGNPSENIWGLILFLLFGLGYFLIWVRREGLAGILFIVWYSALWPVELRIEGELFQDITAPGIIAVILGILLLVYRVGIIQRKRRGIQGE